MSRKLKIQQHELLHNDEDAGKLHHEDDYLWNYFPWRGHVAYDAPTNSHEVYSISDTAEDA